MKITITITQGKNYLGFVTHRPKQTAKTRTG